MEIHGRALRLVRLTGETLSAEDDMRAVWEKEKKTRYSMSTTSSIVGIYSSRSRCRSIEAPYDTPAQHLYSTLPLNEMRRTDILQAFFV